MPGTHAADGRAIWRRPLPDGASDLAASEDPSGLRIWVAAGHAGLVLLDAKGRIAAVAQTAGRAESIAILRLGAAVSDSNGTITAFASE